MKAVTISKNGVPEVLEIRDIKLEDPKSGEVLIKNEAIGLNYIDTYHRSVSTLLNCHLVLELKVQV